MATLNELYNQYLSLAYRPGTTIGGLSSLTEIKRPEERGDSDAEVAPYYSDRFMGNPQAKSMYTSPYPIGFMDIFSGISGIAAKAMGYPDIGYALGALTGWGEGGPGMSYGASNRSGAVDTGDFGSTVANQNNYGGFTHDMSESSPGGTGGGGGMGSSDPGGSDSMGSFATGGRVNYLQGGLISLLGNHYGKR